jgi:hypothetical protein
VVSERAFEEGQSTARRSGEDTELTTYSWAWSDESVANFGEGPV